MWKIRKFSLQSGLELIFLSVDGSDCFDGRGSECTFDLFWERKQEGKDLGGTMDYVPVD